MIRAQIGFALTAAALAVALPDLVTIRAQTADAPVEVRVPLAPAPVMGSDGLTHLGYEVHITNFYQSTGDLRVEAIDVFGDSSTAPLASLESSAIADVLTHPGGETDSGSGQSIAAGRRGVLYLWISLRTGDRIPTSLRHRVVFSTSEGEETVMDGAWIAVEAARPLTLGAPFKQGLWLTANGPGNHRAGHWGPVLAFNGRVVIPERFAIDFMGVNADGLAVEGDFSNSTNEDWAGWGQDVLAVADGIIREARDGQPDHTPLAPFPRTEPTLEASGGNYVLLDLGNDVFVFYAHLQRNSLAVRAGDRVSRGQVLGRLGNSGSTNAPHLHLHVMDSSTLAEGEGRPFVFEAFDLLGATTAERAIGAEASSPDSSFSPEPRQQALPLDGAVVRFPNN